MIQRRAAAVAPALAAVLALAAPAEALETYDVVFDIPTLLTSDGESSAFVEFSQDGGLLSGDASFIVPFNVPAFDSSRGTLLGASVAMKARISPTGVTQAPGDFVSVVFGSAAARLQLDSAVAGTRLFDTGRTSVNLPQYTFGGGPSPLLGLPGALDMSIDETFDYDASTMAQVAGGSEALNVKAEVSFFLIPDGLRSGGTARIDMFPNATGTVTVSYDYEPFAVVPLPAGALLSAAAFAAAVGLNGAARRRRRPAG